MKIKLLGIDLAKNVFQLCALNQANKVLFNRTVRRAQFRSTIAKLEPTTIAMEACSSAITGAGRLKPWVIRCCWCPPNMSARLCVVARATPVMHWLSVKQHSAG